MENELNSHKIEPLIYVPNVLGYKHDKDYLFMDPGYIIGDPNVFSLFVGASIADMSKWLKNFEAEPEERDRAMQAAAISLCFSTLVGQAHFLGFVFNSIFLFLLILFDFYRLYSVE